MNTVETLKAAKALISDPAKWTRGQIARDAEGRFVRARDPEAVCWCSYGAIDRVCGKDAIAWAGATVELMNAMRGGIAMFNDNNDHAAVMAAFDRAIEQAEADANGA